MDSEIERRFRDLEAENHTLRDMIKVLSSKFDDKCFNLLYTKTKEVKDPVRGHCTDAGIDFFFFFYFESTTLNHNVDILIDSGIKVRL